MTTYRVLVSDQLLTQAESWVPVEGFRLVSADGPWLQDPAVTVCTFEDDEAPAELEGQLIALTLQRQPDGTVAIMDRTVVTA